MYDLIIIGGGPAGYLASERASEGGLKTLVIEKQNLGGVCLNEGCIPSKAFLYSAKIFDNAKHGEKYGVHTKDITIKHDEVLKRKNKVVNMLVSAVAAALKTRKVDVVNDTAVIKGKSSEGYIVEAGGKKYSAQRLLIATGSSSITPNIEGLDACVKNNFALTNREILDITDVPKQLVIIGGGVIGLEMASYFSAVGSDVTVIEMLAQIGGPINKTFADILQKRLASNGAKFILEAKVVKFEKNKIFYEKDGKTQSVSGDKCLLSIGRRANTENIGLESIGVSAEKGRIVCDEKMKTNAPNVYVAGDANGVSMLAHTAYREAEVAVNNMLGKKDRMSYSAIPAVIYTNPEVASVGLTKNSAKQNGIDIEVVNIPMYYSGRYVAENEITDGVCEIVIDKSSNSVIGCSMIGNYASEIILAAGTMIEKCMSIDEIKKIVFAHPTVGEIIREGIFKLKL